MCYSHIWQNFGGAEYLCKLGKEYLNASLCKFDVYSLQHSEAFDISHVFLPLTIEELSMLKQVQFFGLPCTCLTFFIRSAHNFLNSGVYGQAITKLIFFRMGDICFSMWEFSDDPVGCRMLTIVNMCLQHYFWQLWVVIFWDNRLQQQFLQFLFCQFD